MLVVGRVSLEGFATVTYHPQSGWYVTPRPQMAEIAESPGESQSFVLRPLVLANLTFREICRPADRRREKQ